MSDPRPNGVTDEENNPQPNGVPSNAVAQSDPTSRFRDPSGRVLESLGNDEDYRLPSGDMMDAKNTNQSYSVAAAATAAPAPAAAARYPVQKDGLQSDASEGASQRISATMDHTLDNDGFVVASPISVTLPVRTAADDHEERETPVNPAPEPAPIANESKTTPSPQRTSTQTILLALVLVVLLSIAVIAGVCGIGGCRRESETRTSASQDNAMTPVVAGTVAPAVAAPVASTGPAVATRAPTPPSTNPTVSPVEFFLNVNETEDIPVDTDDEAVAPEPDADTVFELVADETDLATLMALLVLSGIEETLPMDGNYTVFAPTDDALAQLDPALVAKLQTPSWGAHLSNLLAFHIVPDTLLFSDLFDGLDLLMLNGENIVVEKDDIGNALLGPNDATYNNSTVIEANLLAGNGVVHKMDSVLLPDWVGTDLMGLGNTTAGQDFTTLFELISLLELGPVLSSAGDVTVFAPTNAAFDALPEGALDELRANTAELISLLTNHFLSNINPSALISDGLVVTSFGGAYNLTFSVTETGVMVNDANIVIADVLANNGIVHAIDKVLLEPFVDPSVQPEPSPMAAPPGDESTAPTKAPIRPALPTAPTATTIDPFTVFELVADETDLSTLTALLDVSGIAETLTLDGSYTVFAPTDDAIAQLDPALLLNLQTPNWGAHLNDLLAFHFTSGTVLSTDLVDGMVVPTLNGEKIAIGVRDTVTITSTFSNESTVTEADLTADNGVVHKIDSVLLPDWVGTDLIGLANTTAGQDFTTLFELISLLDLGAVLDLAGDVTVFAPTNEAFAALPEGALDELIADNADLLRLLTNHFLRNINPSALISDGLVVTSFGGAYDLTFSVTETGVMVNDASIIMVDVLANNGIVHGIDKVLLEPFVASNVTDINADAQPEPSMA